MAKTAQQLTPDRGGDDVKFLPSRQRTTPVDARTARAQTSEFMRAVQEADSLAGGVAHDQGMELKRLYDGHVDVALGFRNFSAFLDKHWPLESSVAYERMRVARLVTRPQSIRFGFTACELGLRIMAAKNVDSFEQFQKTPLHLDEADGGGVIHFPAPTRQLRSVLKRLSKPTHAEADRPDGIGERLSRYRAEVSELVQSDPGIAELKPVVFADQKGAYVRVTAGSAEHAKAAARLYQRLARLG